MLFTVAGNTGGHVRATPFLMFILYLYFWASVVWLGFVCFNRRVRESIDEAFERSGLNQRLSFFTPLQTAIFWTIFALGWPMAVRDVFRQWRAQQSEPVPTVQTNCIGCSDDEGEFVFALRAGEVERFRALLDQVIDTQFKGVGRCFYCGITLGECESFNGVHYPGCTVDAAKSLKNLLSHAPGGDNAE